MADAAKWYVVHTYSGYENTVKATIEKTVETRHLQDLIHIGPGAAIFIVGNCLPGDKQLLCQFLLR